MLATFEDADSDSCHPVIYITFVNGASTVLLLAAELAAVNVALVTANASPLLYQSKSFTSMLQQHSCAVVSIVDTHSYYGKCLRTVVYEHL